jgi:hypothetical protein
LVLTSDLIRLYPVKKDLKAFYLVHEEALLIAVVRIASRGDVYQ